MTAPAGSPSPTQDAACQLIRRGYAPISVPRGEKNPNYPGWQNLRLVERDTPKHFTNGQNVSLLLGEPSHGLIDVDLDCAETVTLAPHFLPVTGMIHGRPSKLRSHWWYITTPSPASVRFKDLGGETLAELRSTGGQTVVPPSIHPSGESIAWDSEGDPERVEPEALYNAVADLAACAFLSRYWPDEGSRHDMVLALSGFLFRRQMPAQRVIRIVIHAANLAGDPEWKERAADVITTQKRIHEGRPATGGTALIALLSPKKEKKGDRGKSIISRLVEWLKLPDVEVDAQEPERERYSTLEGRLHRIKYKKIVDPDTWDEQIVSEHIPLCNFTSEIVEQLELDDGRDVTRVYSVRGTLDSGETLPLARVKAKDFPALTWVGDQWGARPRPYAGATTRDYIREAIQYFSKDVPSRTVYTHTGWRVFDGKYAYLLPSGTIGRDDLEVDLGSPELARISIPVNPEDELGAVRDSLATLDVAPYSVTIPLLAAMFRAPLCHALPAPITVWLEGKTGSFKSTLEALFLSHYGAFDYTSLLAQWSSTANFLERRMFTLKDFPLVIDDYVPGTEQKNVEATAARVVRAQGNLAGRGRLNADSSERGSYYPRGVTVTSGEQRPPGAGILARCLLVPVDAEQVNVSALTKAQGRAGRLPHAMSGYIRWLAPQMNELPAILQAELAQSRAASSTTGPGMHRRVPTTMAHLALGFTYFLAYAQAIGALTPAEADVWRRRAEGVFEEGAERQASAIRSEAAEIRFLRVLDELVTRGKVKLADRDTGQCAGDVETDRADFLGWEDAEYWYLLPDAAHEWVTRACEQQREPLNARPERIREDLIKLGVATGYAGRTTVPQRVGRPPRQQRVLKINRQTMLATLSGRNEEEDDGELVSRG